jgi:hypothetical protein
MSVGEKYDEISGGPAGRPRRPWRFWLIATLVAATVAGVALYQRGGRSPATTPTTPPPQGRVLVAAVCPVTSDGHRSLTVSFVLRNDTGAAVRIRTVDPVPIMEGLRQVSVTTAAGTCENRGPAPVEGALRAGGTLLVTFQFEVVAGTCPQPIPVQVAVQIEARGELTTSQLPVLNDLGDVPFDTCPTTR